MHAQHLLRARLGAALLLLAGGALGASAAPISDWSFSEAAGSTLNLTVNSGTGVDGPATTWDVAISGVATDGNGALRVRNTGGGGSGTRTTYADFGPVPAAVSSGLVELYASFSAWNLAGAAAGGPAFTLALVEGNDFTTAQFTLAAGPAGLSLSGSSDAFGNGGNVAQTAAFAASGTQLLTVRLTVDLDALSYGLAYNIGSGSAFVPLGSAAVDSFTAGVNSLRLSLSGDFTVGGQADRGLSVDRIWVTTSAVPEPAAAWLMLLGGCGLALAMRCRHVR